MASGLFMEQLEVRVLGSLSVSPRIPLSMAVLAVLYLSVPLKKTTEQTSEQVPRDP